MEVSINNSDASQFQSDEEVRSAALRMGKVKQSIHEMAMKNIKEGAETNENWLR